MSDFLAEMIVGARERVAAASAQRPLARAADVTADGRAAGAGRFTAALASPGAGPNQSTARGARRDRLATQGAAGAPHRAPRLALIAEVKRRSPSKGDIAHGLDAVAQARAYEAAGADAVSVLTEPSRFGGSLEDLRAVAAAVRLPVLRKDFIVDVYQVWEAAEAGAAALLLIVAALSDAELAALLDEVAACGMDALVEVHDEAELRRALAAGASLVGVNNRNLRTLTVDLAVTERLAPMAPPGVLLVAESGVGDAADARRVARAGARALLVGEALVRAGHEQLPARVEALRDAALGDADVHEPASPAPAPSGPDATPPGVREAGPAPEAAR